MTNEQHEIAGAIRFLECVLADIDTSKPYAFRCGYAEQALTILKTALKDRYAKHLAAGFVDHPIDSEQPLTMEDAI